MKLTPLDIHHKEFHHALRGYSEEEVDTFLDEVADEFERLFKENIDMAEKLEAATAKVRDYQAMEVTLNNTMVAAQRSAEQIVAQANEDGTTILRDAEVKAKELIHGALTEKQRTQGELVRIKQAEGEFRDRFRALLDQYLRGISEIALPADVNLLVGTTDEGKVADVEVRPAQSSFETGTYVSDAVSAVAFETPAAPQEQAPAPEDTEAVGVSSGVEPFVTSVGLGEIVPPDLSAEEPEFDEPSEFAIPSFDAFGEREDDVDIEEID